MTIRFSLRTSLLGLAVTSILLAFLVLQRNKVLHDVDKMQCVVSGKAIFFGIVGYRNKYSSFPPKVVMGPDGLPWHSWRILILEFLDPATFQQYSFDEPWNGPNNKRLLDSIPSYYRCRLDRRSDPTFTSYVAEDIPTEKVRDGWIWRVVEARHDIPWLAPLDSSAAGHEFQDECWPPTIIDDRHVFKIPQGFDSAESR